MFIHNTTSAINQKAALNPGIYHGNAALYANDTSSQSVLMAEYRVTTETCICAVELFICESDGSFEYRSFVKLENGTWRNNFGETSQQLTDFLPEGILNFRVYKNMTLSPQVVVKETPINDLVFMH